MPRGSQELTNERKKEIIRACASIYKTMCFKDMTIKEIAAATSFTRTSIYNYFQTKEEILLALFLQEYQEWTAELEKIAVEHEVLTSDELAQALAHSMEERGMLLKLLSMNLYDMEENSRVERLTSFKAAYGNSIHAVSHLLEKFCPQMDAAERQRFIYAFFPFIYGIYPYTTVTEKQRASMEAAGVDFVYLSVYEMVYDCARTLLAGVQ